MVFLKKWPQKIPMTSYTGASHKKTWEVTMKMRYVSIRTMLNMSFVNK